MIEILDHIDKQWLLALNNDYPTFWDGLMMGFTEKLTWIPLYLSIIFILFKKWKNQAWWIIIGLVLCVTIADQVASGLLKETVQRLRPSRDPQLEGMVEIVNGYRAGKYGFASSHAANSFGLAMLSTLIFRNRNYAIAIFLWAAINAYSRIYLGVHYPGDILTGMLIGVGAAWLVYWLLKKFRPQIFTENSSVKIQAVIPIIVLGLSVLGLIIYSIWFFAPMG
ncbi:MAG: phosphatase PAP2 family protein [Paludibacteraceae bacterium]